MDQIRTDLEFVAPGGVGGLRALGDACVRNSREGTEYPSQAPELPPLLQNEIGSVSLVAGNSRNLVVYLSADPAVEVVLEVVPLGLGEAPARLEVERQPAHLHQHARLTEPSIKGHDDVWCCNFDCHNNLVVL